MELANRRAGKLIEKVSVFFRWLPDVSSTVQGLYSCSLPGPLSVLGQHSVRVHILHNKLPVAVHSTGSKVEENLHSTLTFYFIGILASWVAMTNFTKMIISNTITTKTTASKTTTTKTRTTWKYLWSCCFHLYTLNGWLISCLRIRKNIFHLLTYAPLVLYNGFSGHLNCEIKIHKTHTTLKWQCKCFFLIKIR